MSNETNISDAPSINPFDSQAVGADGQLKEVLGAKAGQTVPLPARSIPGPCGHLVTKPISSERTVIPVEVEPAKAVRIEVVTTAGGAALADITRPVAPGQQADSL